MTDSSRERQEEEVYALDAIYGDDCVSDREQQTWEVWIPSRAAVRNVRLRVHLPANYPEEVPPIPELHGADLAPELLEWATKELEGLYVQGEEVLYTWVEFLREHDELWEPASMPNQDTCPADGLDTQRGGGELEEGEAFEPAEEVWEEGQAAGSGADRFARWRPALGPDGPASVPCPEIIHGEPFTERKSTFQAHVAAVTSLEQVEAVMGRLMENNKIQRASHNILAYRIYNAETDAFFQDFDDDGESAAGSRLLHLLRVVDARNVVVVVTRWFGGIHLGPARFTHINNAARLLLSSSGFVKQDTAQRKKK